MKILVYILSISNAICMTWIVQDHRLNNKVPFTSPGFSDPVRNTPLPLREVPEAQLLPEIEEFNDALTGPQGELFPDIAEAKPKKRR